MKYKQMSALGGAFRTVLDHETKIVVLTLGVAAGLLVIFYSICGGQISCSKRRYEWTLRASYAVICGVIAMKAGTLAGTTGKARHQAAEDFRRAVLLRSRQVIVVIDQIELVIPRSCVTGGAGELCQPEAVALRQARTSC
jgi:hypothetical protein